MLDFQTNIMLGMHRSRMAFAAPIQPLTYTDREGSVMANRYIPYDGPVVTRDESLKSGLKRFFTGAPCVHGHLSQRMTSSKRCMTCGLANANARHGRLKDDAEYRSKNCEKASRNYYDNREVRLAYVSARRIKPDVMAASNAWKRAERATPMGSLNHRMSRGILGSLGAAKSGRSWQSLVNYTVAQLSAHLERQFVKGMSWSNHGKWHIDHIVPLASFTFESSDDQEFKVAWALTNLRPLWRLDNLRKSARREFLL